MTMCMYQDEESGEFRPILPPEDLQGIYGRITENEIQVGGGGLLLAIEG